MRILVYSAHLHESTNTALITHSSNSSKCNENESYQPYQRGIHSTSYSSHPSSVLLALLVCNRPPRLLRLNLSSRLTRSCNEFSLCNASMTIAPTTTCRPTGWVPQSESFAYRCALWICWSPGYLAPCQRLCSPLRLSQLGAYWTTRKMTCSGWRSRHGVPRSLLQRHCSRYYYQLVLQGH